MGAARNTFDETEQSKNQNNLNKMNCQTLSHLGICIAFITIVPAAATGATMLSLVQTGSSASSGAVNSGTPLSLDLLVDTGGNNISGLQYYFTASPANTLRFSATPLTLLNSPFTAADVFSAPQGGAIVNQIGGTTVLFKAVGADYPAFSNSSIARYVFNTTSLVLGDYVITPVGEELTNANTTVTTFAAPGSFRLTVNVPEPATVMLATFGGTLLLIRRRFRNKEQRQ